MSAYELRISAAASGGLFFLEESFFYHLKSSSLNSYFWSKPDY